MFEICIIKKPKKIVSHPLALYDQNKKSMFLLNFFLLKKCESQNKMLQIFVSYWFMNNMNILDIVYVFYKINFILINNRSKDI